MPNPAKDIPLLALFGGLSERASDQYERAIAHLLRASGRPDLVEGERVLVLRHMVMPDLDIGDVEKVLLGEDKEKADSAARALAFCFGMGCQEAVFNGARAVALACNTHSNFFPPHVEGAQVLDIANAALAAAHYSGLQPGDRMLVIGTTITSQLPYWRQKIKGFDASPAMLGRDASGVIDQVFVAESVPVNSPPDMHEQMQAGWRSTVDTLATRAEARFVFEACTDIEYPLSVAGETLPQSGAQVIGTFSAHTASLAMWLKQNVPVLTADQRAALQAQPAKQFLFGHERADRPFFGGQRTGVTFEF